MYFVGLHNGQVIVLNYYMLNIMFHVNGTIDSGKMSSIYNVSFHACNN